MSTDLQVASALDALNDIEKRRYALYYALASIGWLAETADPPKATPGRGEALAELDARYNELLTGPELGAALDVLRDADGLTWQQRAQVRVASRDRAEQSAIPPELAARWCKLTNEATAAWLEAKANNRWEVFEPYLDRLVALAKERCERIDPGRDPYDVALDQNEHGTDRAFYDAFFAELRETVVPLVHAVERAPQISADCVRGTFDRAGQWELTRDLAFSEGVDPEKLVLAETEHPFSEGIDSDHVFIATHIYPDDVLSGVFSVLHEGGHAMYEAGVDPAFNYTCLRGGTSMGVHESQSRFFENMVGRSRAYAPRLLAAMATHFPDQMRDVTAHELYKACNRSQPSLVRTEADELTYPLHIMVRYEVEQALFAGEVTAAGVPALWAEKYRQYLGIEVPDDRRGALQDVHWSQGMFGYFPTYALGSAYAAQFAHAMAQDLAAAGTPFHDVLASGDLAPVRAWLERNVWQWGRAKEPAQIVADACGEPFDPGHYTRYLTDKFSALYHLG